jgi:hypothetical protein
MKTAGILAILLAGSAAFMLAIGEPASQAQSAPDLIIAFSGDLRGYLEECG